MNGAELWARAEAEERKRAEDMPTEEDAIRSMARAHQRLTELGWKSISYAPKDGSKFDAVEAGCGKSGRCMFVPHGVDGSFFMAEVGDLWPSRPCLFKPEASP